MSKTCTFCKIEKDENCFEKHRNKCRDCRSKYLKKWRDDSGRAKSNPKPAIVITYSGATMECITCKKTKAIELFDLRTDTKKRRSQCQTCRKAYIKSWKHENIKPSIPPLCKQCGTTRTYKPKCFRCKQKDTMRERYGSDLGYKLKVLHRSRIRAGLKGIKLTSYEKYLGCEWDYLIEWLEYLFDEGMTWENYGTLWHVDHVLPINNFDLTNEGERRICFRWTNLQPKLAFDNCSKNDKIYMHEYFNILVSITRFVQYRPIESVYQSINESLCWLREKTQVR